MQRSAIVVLGNSVARDGTLPEAAKRLVERAAEEYRDGNFDAVLFTGRWSHRLKFTPAKSEASAMADYAATLGIPQGCIIKEEMSQDTIGNAFFSRKLLEGYRNLLVVVYDYHRNRAEFIFRKVFGEGYRIKFSVVTSLMDKKRLELVKEAEEHSFLLVKLYFNGIKDGDYKAIERLVNETHQIYAASPKIPDWLSIELRKLDTLREKSRKS
jgi:uncharacterized SAM-binding protein YcdF (DUF218 family)